MTVDTELNALDELHRRLIAEANYEDRDGSMFNAGLRTGYRDAARMIRELRSELEH